MAESARPTILLVEDERSIAEPFAGALAREGFEPVIAETARAALELFQRHDPSLVLLDIALPDGDGREVCRALRRESSVPIIMLTARGTETDRVVGLELGADDYVVKPFSSAEVIARIRAVLRRTGREPAHDPPPVRSTGSAWTLARGPPRSTAPRSTSRARSSTCSRGSCATPAASCRART